MKILNYSFLLILAVALVSCKGKVTKNAFKHGDVLKASINDFESDRQKFSSQVSKTIDVANETLTEENPDVQKIAKDWEKEWDDIQSRYDKLRKDFDKVGESSTAYFAKLDELSNNIRNEELRNEELAKNAELRNRWQGTYDNAAVSIDKVTEVLDAGNDFHMVLVASGVRQKIEQNVADLTVIAEQAKELLKDLETFSEEGRKLVEG